ncbi:MAG: murein L,D-transpeptidase [Nitriliruptor sp.]|nr:MAG: murein L,D-transpeptidase [Nitriliruptor sp.]
MTALEAPWTSGLPAPGSRRRRPAAGSILVLLVVVLATSGTALVSAGTWAGTPAAVPPVPDLAGPAVPAGDVDSHPDTQPPADDGADGGMVPPVRRSDADAEAPQTEPAVEPPAAPSPPEPTEPTEPTEPAEPAEPTDPPVAEEPTQEPSTVEPAPTPEPLDLVAVQRRLKELGYLLGPADGVEGQQTRASVMAFQRVNGLSVDGIVGPVTLAALDSPVAPELSGGPATRIEIDLTRQLAHVVREGTRVVTLHVSSGNGEAYRGGTAYARTPVGDFRIERRIHGERHAELGVLYDPLYFYRGFAIHGSNSVPNHPASHGCIRVTRADARWLISNVADGTPVQLYGGLHVFSPSR